MQSQERPSSSERSTLSQDEAFQILANTRRTLLKLVSNIDSAIGAVDSQDWKEERVQKTTR